MAINEYEKNEWLDHIVDPTEYERDSNDNVIMDPITNKPKPKVIQEGTRFTAKRANHIEEGIFNAYELLIDQDREIQRLRTQMEIDGRVPSNSGAFFDSLDGSLPNKMQLLSKEVDVISPVSAGGKVLPVNDAGLFSTFTEVTIYDGTNHEANMITSVDTEAKTISVQALANNYVKGARIAQSNIEMNTEDRAMNISSWGTYTISFSEGV